MRISILDLISEGEENAVTSSELCRITGLNQREVTLCVNALRRSGNIICSSGNGYFLPSCLHDVEKFYRQMTSRQKEIERAKHSAKEYIEKHGGYLYE